MTSPRPRLLSVIVAVLSLAVVFAVACGGDSKDGGEAPQGTPADWKPFTAGAWSGWVAPDWRVISIDKNNIGDPALQKQVPQASLQTVDRLISTGTMPGSTYVFIDEGSGTPKSINLLGCFKESESAPNDRLVESFSALGVKAAIRGSALFDGVRWNVAQVDVDPDIGMIQVYPHKGDCYLTFTFLTQRGDTESVVEFVRFVQALRVDTSKLR